LLVEHDGTRIMIDCGADWLGCLRSITPTAIVLTHAHSDHAAGLAKGAPCPVYATAATWRLLDRFPIRERHRVAPRKHVTIGGMRFEAFPVHHSIRAPAVGYRVSAKGCCFFYLPDVAELPDAPGALRGVDIYIGDGATVTRSMVRMKNTTPVGHAPVVAQLGWCERANVRHAIFTHCGSPIVRANARVLNASIRRLGSDYGIDVRIACDGDRLSLGGDERNRMRR
jgi:phosphoribosyl 1,2-cyclic phosphodiesterase